jgi:hypothetical protein
VTAASFSGDEPCVFVYANPYAKPPPRHALARTLWFLASIEPTVMAST